MTTHESALAHAVASATDPLELAVVLESAGVTDRVAAGAFGVPDVFALAELSHDPQAPLAEPVAAPAARRLRLPGDHWTFHLRGLLYAVPAAVALSLLPGGDPVASTLLLGGLLAAWAGAYGVTAVAWAHLGNLDVAASRRFLRRALLGGTALAALLAVPTVYLALVTTSTMAVDLTTIALLTAQTAYLLAAATLLVCGREVWLAAALLPAVAGVVLALERSPDLRWPAASVALAVVFALIATRGAGRPRQRLARRARVYVGVQVVAGLLVGLLAVFPAVDQLVRPGFDPLPLSVTVVALPLVLGMGLAESLALRLRRRFTTLLATTSSPPVFARAARRATLGAHLVLGAALVVMTAAVVFAVVHGGHSFGTEPRLLLLAGDYVVLGIALFSATVLAVLGAGGRAVAALAAGVAVLAAFLVLAADEPTPGWVPLACHAAVSTALLLALGVLVHRRVGRPVHHR
ncbi:hypothetical protein [Pseudonocardia sp.]|uniref:hypothetical protein n=1 Tax=Pseudonocardia sp. TaxID=60912 RepID=UPI003D0B0522